MTIRFLHTADWQLGKPFAAIEDSHNRALVQQERIDAIDRIGAAAREGDARFVIIAGDLFDSPSATKTTVAAACAAIGRIGLPVFAIPGNHDHAGPGSLWSQPFFRHENEHLAPNLRVLLAAEPVELDDVVLLPCPLLRRHETADPTAWLHAVDLDQFGEKPRIVIAHGSVCGFTEEDSAINRLDLTRLPEHVFDYIALGDWHGMKQVAEKAWYAGTPELDRFVKTDGHDPGHVLLVTATRDAPPQIEVVRTARLGWHRLAFDFAADADLERLEAEVESCISQRAQSDLLELKLGGMLGIEATGRLARQLEAWEARLLRLALRKDIRVAPTEDELAALTQRAADPLMSRVAANLVERSRGGDAGEAELALLALRELHAACNKIQQRKT
jgi:DNA repair exonuclease SbcCD nuclease subunit